MTGLDLERAVVLDTDFENVVGVPREEALDRERVMLNQNQVRPVQVCSVSASSAGTVKSNHNSAG